MYTAGGKLGFRETSISFVSLDATWASPLSTRTFCPLTACAVVKAGFRSSLNHMRTCWGAAFKTASFAGSDRKGFFSSRLGRDQFMANGKTYQLSDIA